MQVPAEASNQSLELKLQVAISLQVWVLRTELRATARATQMLSRLPRLYGLVLVCVFILYIVFQSVFLFAVLIFSPKQTFRISCTLLLQKMKINIHICCLPGIHIPLTTPFCLCFVCLCLGWLVVHVFVFEELTCVKRKLASSFMVNIVYLKLLVF